LSSAGRAASTHQLHRHFHSSLKAFKNKKRQIDNGSNQELSWETFEFSGVPKLDRRFADPASAPSSDDDDLLTNEERLQQLQQQETERDARYQEEQRQKLTAWEQLDPASVQRATEAIRPIVNDDRVQRIAAVLEQRTAHTRFLFESTLRANRVRRHNSLLSW